MKNPHEECIQGDFFFARLTSKERAQKSNGLPERETQYAKYPIE
jgi:hypothetical protein